jgi:hypothetical protein
MNARTHSEVAIETAQGKEHLPNLIPDSPSEGASFGELMPAPNAIRTYVPDDRTFETFFGGAGI